MRAQKGYLMSKGVKLDEPARTKPNASDVKRWKAMMEREDEQQRQEAA